MKEGGGALGIRAGARLHPVGETLLGQIPTQQPEQRPELAQLGFSWRIRAGAVFGSAALGKDLCWNRGTVQGKSTGRKEGITEMNCVLTTAPHSPIPPGPT